MTLRILPAIIWLALTTESRCSRGLTTSTNSYCPPCGPEVDKNLVCSKPVKAQSMPLLEPHINSGLGVSLKAHNGKYLSVIGRYYANVPNIEAAKDVKDAWTQFIIEKVGEDTVYLKSAKSNKYLTRWDAHSIWAAKIKPDQYCLFTVYEEGGKLVLKGDNGYFLSVIDRGGIFHIESIKNGIGKWSRFVVETGSVTPVKEELVSVSFGKFQETKDIKPMAAAVRTVANNSSRDVLKTVSLAWTHTTSQQTSWEHAWGVTTKHSFKSKCWC
eukprot:TRINITY_DN16070_c0_g1_i1.p1 TRINITY_DN16070_c0_g1~~TRINITY_DN16070_c0_g1_i1.p1  ORF type:complete len:293 (-),score=35.03 TRINITY_DN16070_c0_g1_i1:439-1251(-)